MSQSIDITFSRLLLGETHKDVRKLAPHLRGHLMRAAWVWRAGRDHWEFHGPDQYYWHGSASNSYEARTKGWNAWLRHKGLAKE